MSLSLLVFGIVLPWLIVALVVAVGAWVGFQLIHQNGRLLSRLESLERRLDQFGMGTAPAPAPVAPAEPAPSLPAGLPMGSLAPDFALPDLAGGRKALADFRGQPVLLLFFNPRCGFCTQIAPDLAALPADGAEGRPVPLVVSTGDREENQQLVREYGIQCPVLLQDGMEVAGQYQCHGTPMGYLIDAEGRIASELAVGGPALLALAGAIPGPPEQNGHAPSNGNGHAALGGRRALAESKIERNGLASGTPAPGFIVPRLEGGELSLATYRGRRVLLVFSDPNCGPCDALAPQLEALSRRTPEVQVLMVSRGDEAANRAKVAEHGFSFPVGLQRQWEISREYGMFATPIAYLIDAEGVIAADVAVGVEPILALLASASDGAGEGAGKRCRCGKRAVGEGQRAGGEELPAKGE